MILYTLFFSDKIRSARLAIFISVLVVSLCLVDAIAFNLARANTLDQQQVAEAVTPHALKNRFPNKLVFEANDGEQKVGYVNYTFDRSVHENLAKVYLQYQPDYACFVALDAETGAILNLTSFVKSDEEWDNLVLRAEYPAASVFKMITAAAGLDSGAIHTNTVIPFNGKSTSLYKSQVLRHKDNKWTRKPTLVESFAKSINSVFARIGIFDVGKDNLREYAMKFGFDKPMLTDFHLPESRIRINFEEQWQVAEAASGYTKDIKLSPIHAAQLAAIVANDGRMVTPYMVESITDQNGELLYEKSVSPDAHQVIKEASAKDMRALMRETTKTGSARRSFTDINRYKVYRNMEIGGKTGSLTGYSPRGRHDWFVGYAEKNGRKVAYASLIVNKEKWYVRSAYVARQFIYHYFTEQALLAKKEQEEGEALAD